MIVFAAIDLQGGEVVQLVGGEPDQARIRWKSARDTALRWQRAGFSELHVIDLDAARGTGSNQALVSEIIGAVNVPVQVGGGLRDRDAIAGALELGAARVIVGTRAIEDPAWLAQASAEFPSKIVVAADVRAGQVLTRGWTHASQLQLGPALHLLDDYQLAAVLITDVGREGRMVGIDAELFRSAVAGSRHPIYAAGGIGGPHDLESLRQCGVAGAVLGMALYTGAIDPGALRQAAS